MRMIICLVMFLLCVNFTSAEINDSTNYVIRDTIAFIQAQREVHAYISDNISDVTIRIRNAQFLIRRIQNRIADIESYNKNSSYNKNCDFYEQTIDYLKVILDDLNRSQSELIKAQRTLEDKIKNIDRRINELEGNIRKPKDFY